MTDEVAPEPGITLGLPGSEVAGIDVDGDRVRIRLAVAQAQRPAAEAGAPPEDGYLPGVELVLAGATLSGDLADAVGALHEGRWTLDGRPLGRLAVPAALDGDVRLALRFGHQAVVAVAGLGLRVRQARPAAFRPSLAC